ncbi:lymphocyte antigen 96 isoform X1 [Orcinus orca]|uniref:lymphocyte antigen 96 isoform X1 n=1 Tax=Globicephala melas TaxID=9731 RepID=UPI00122F65EF|nr:lymphocyte antigen 96 isoform X1 [Globicephala melas]XP_049556340.1 lymphocyte antigen 96 isoform X1 [Orcinus orca]
MFPFMLFSALFSSTFTEPGEKRWICNSSDTSVWYSYCDNLKFPISINAEPCITLKGGRGNLYLYYIPRRDIKSLYFNIYVSFKSVNFPVRKQVICRGSDDDYSFCRALKGGSGRAGSVAMTHGPSPSAACGIFLDRGTNPCPLHQEADSQPLRHQGSPNYFLFKN